MSTSASRLALSQCPRCRGTIDGPVSPAGISPEGDAFARTGLAFGQEDHDPTQAHKWWPTTQLSRRNHLPVKFFNPLWRRVVGAIFMQYPPFSESSSAGSSGFPHHRKIGGENFSCKRILVETD